ncbi:MAG: 3-phosphoserine/phosphohydroxythreonine transaminase [Gammaproteobacteria bacterium]|nr:3-phosphoserine/phosphohydroxythreonine transaminase [Gammaproteobacteria bacterium]
MKIYNFCSGPAILPDEVLQEASQALIDWRGLGSFLAISHRSPEFQTIARESERDLRVLLNIPDTYHVLFLAGGASSQFAMVPMNLLGDKKSADYVNSGYWSEMAIKEARRYAEINVISEANAKTWAYKSEAAYIHCVPNETVQGVSIPYIPDCGDVPIVADMSSCLLSAPIDITKFGLIYAGSHKNIGAAGMTLVIVRKDFIQIPLPNTPSLYNYQILADAHSLYNTPPTFAWYTASLVFTWLLNQGGLAEMAKRNAEKAALLYEYIDSSKFYKNRVPVECRSLTNITFQLSDPHLELKFITQSQTNGLLNLKGHRSLGGLRASLYNAMPIEGVKSLIHFMREFEHQYVNKTS